MSHIGINHMSFFVHVLKCQKNQAKSKSYVGYSSMTNNMEVTSLSKPKKKKIIIKKSSLSRTLQKMT